MAEKRGVIKGLARVGLVVIVALLAACANMQLGYQQPDVHLTKIQPLPGEGLEQRFLIGLRILNPNAIGLDISGLSYNLSLQGQKVVSGVSAIGLNIPAYGEAEVDLEASASLLGGLRALAEIINNPGKSVDYEFEARLNTGLWSWPISVVESGSIALE